VVDEGVAEVDVGAAEEELVEHPEVVDPVEVAEEAEVVAEEEEAVGVHPDLPMFEEMPTDLGTMICTTDPVVEASLQLNLQQN
jgi:hypothetical protein